MTARQIVSTFVPQMTSHLPHLAGILGSAA